MRWPTQAVTLGVPTDPAPPPPPTSGAVAGITRHGTPSHQLFSPTCYLNTPLPAATLVDPNSAAVITELVSESGLGAKPTVNTTRYSMPSYTVPGTFPRVPVKMHDSPIPNYKLAMSQLMLDPGCLIPPEYVNQGDTDDEMLVYCPDLDVAQEFWRLRPITPQDVTITQSDGTVVTYHNVAYECTSYWNITTVSTHPGTSRNHNSGVYPNAPTPLGTTTRINSENTNMSVSATRIPFLGTQLTEEDVTRYLGSGIVPDHPLNLSVVYPVKTTHRFPASTTDGFSTTSPIVEGMVIRFPSTYTVPGTLHPIAQCIAATVRDRGMIVVDKSGALEIDGEPSVHDHFAGTAPSSILNGFEWNQLQVVAVGTAAVPYPT